MVKHRGDDICGVLLLDKPSGRSSNFYLQRIKYLFNAKKAGHTGSLDPLATGLLPICFGKATCLSEYFLHSDKSYEATIQLGVITDSHDCDGEVVERREVKVTDQQLQAALEQFVGEIEQVPPMVSALKHQGQPLYKLALKGQEIERKARKMTVFSLTGELLKNDQVCLQVHCSSGFYVRQLAADLGEQLGCGAHITKLRRTTSKYLQIADAVSFDQIEAEITSFSDNSDARTAFIVEKLLPADALLQSLPALNVDQVNAEHVSHGRAIDLSVLNTDKAEQKTPIELIDGQHFRLYQSVDGQDSVHFLGIAERKGDHQVKVRRLFNQFV